VTRDGTAPQIPQVPAGDSAHNVHGDGQALCTATFIYMNPTKEASLLLRYIDDYSTRSWKLKDSCMFNAGFSNLHFGWPSAGETQQWEFEDFLSFDSNNYTVSRLSTGAPRSLVLLRTSPRPSCGASAAVSSTRTCCRRSRRSRTLARPRCSR
jgi:hypothetical protein